MFSQNAIHFMEEGTNRAEKKPQGAEETVQWVADRNLPSVPDDFGKLSTELIRAKWSFNL